jgi:hypothetical protein
MERRGFLPPVASWRAYEHFVIHERSLYAERLPTNVEALQDLPNLRLANTYGKYYEALCSRATESPDRCKHVF